MRKTAIILTLLVGLSLTGAAQATLIDRGGGLLYDDVLDLTWLQDANYAQTSRYDTDGRMDWRAAGSWADNLVFHDSVRNVDYSDWRLAANTPVGADWNYVWSVDGSTDRGYNITSPHSELSYMYYVNLGLKAFQGPGGAFQPDFGIFGNGTWDGQANVGLVRNLQSYVYWSGTAFPVLGGAWRFGTDVGYQDHFGVYSEYYAWPVRAGDVAAVPEPEVYAMLLAGLVSLGLANWRRRYVSASCA